MAIRFGLGAVTATAMIAALGVGGLAATAAADEGPVDAGITVPRVDGMRDDFINGVDVSSVLSLEESGVVFRDDTGAEADLFDVLADHDVNWVRVRVWNDPFDSEGNGYGAGNMNAERATEVARRATDAGMRVLVNFHYSDFWAHPGQQISPKDWQGLALADRVDALYDYTADTLRMMADAGADIGMVQIGNETTSGEIAGEAGWDRTAQLFQAGSEAVRDTLGEDVKVALHFTNPERAGQYASVAAALDARNVDYDVFASSYYPFWHGTLDNLRTVLNHVASTYDKEVMVAEVSWAYTLEDGDGHENVIRTAYPQYSTSVQGQALVVRDTMQAMADIVDGKGLGTFYWEPAWLPVGPPSQVESNRALWEQYGSGWATSASYEYIADPWFGGSAWDNQAMFDFEGNPLESLNVYRYARTGAIGPREVDSVAHPTITVTEGQTITLPAEVDVRYTDGVTESQAVTWHANPAWIQDAGEYTVTGTTSADLGVEASITVLAAGSSGENMVLNPGFETGTSPWTGSGSGYTISRAQDPYEGSRSLHFWQGSAYSFAVEQTITGVPAGTYRLSAKVQGGDAGPADRVTITAASGIASVSAQAQLQGYNVWQTPTTDLLTVSANGTVVVSLSASLQGGAWGSIDNVALVAEQPVEPGDVTELESLVTTAHDIDRSAYSPASLVALDRALDRAEFVLASPSPGQATVDAAVAALSAAIDALVPDDGTTPDPTVHPVSITVVEGDAISLPSTVTVEAYDGSTQSESVTWSDAVELITSPGTYTVTGVTANGWTATATITVTVRNWILNPGFEQGVDDVSPWVIEADPWPSESSGFYWVAQSGDAIDDHALNVFVETAANGGQPFAFTATQDITGLEPGVYRLAGSLMGADEGSPSASASVTAVTSEGEESAALQFLGWPTWDEATVDITVPADGAVTVGVAGQAGVGDWAWIDEFSLIRVGDSVDRSALEAAVEAAESIDTAGFTADSVAALARAVERARVVLDASQPTQAQVDGALADLEAAVAGLEETGPTPTPTPDPSVTPTPDPSVTPTPGPSVAPTPGPTSDPAPTVSPGGPDGQPRIVAPTTTLRPGQTVTLTLLDIPGEWVEVGVASEYRRLATASLVDGSATVTVTIPLDMEPGIHHLQVRNADGEILAELQITVVAATDGGLSATGAELLVPLAIAMALLAAGAALALRSRRVEA